jgi:Mg-chelatase subunit ChlD
LFFIGHGVGGLLVKEVASEIINSGFGIPHFRNPVKACFFFGVPNQAGDEENGFSTILANMRSALKDGNPPDPTLLHALSPRHVAISSISIEFEAIRKEYDITCITVNGKHETAGCLIVPPHQSTLDEDPDKAFHFEVDYRDIVRPPRDEDNLEVVLDVMCETMCEKMNLQYSPTSRPRSRAKSEPTPRRRLAPNPEIQATQKEKVYARLRKYDTVFLVDDSGSMYGKRWDTTKEIVAEIAHIAVKYDSDGVDVRFFNAYFKKEERLCLDSSKKVMDLFNKVEVDGETPTAEILDQELNEYIHDYKDNRHKKGLNLVVLTDGEPDDGQKVEDVIVKYARKLAELDAPTLHVGIQFVQIGVDKKAALFLKSLDDDLQTKFNLDRDVSASIPSECTFG